MRTSAAAATVLVLSGCVAPAMHQGKLQRPPDAADVAQEMLQKGVTLKKEVLDRFGPPDRIMQGTEVPSAKAATIWIYSTAYRSTYSGNVGIVVAGGSTSSALEQESFVIIYFDGQDVVRDYSMKRLKQ